MKKQTHKILGTILLLVSVCGNILGQTVSFPQEPMLARVERIAEKGKATGQFLTYESRFLDGITAQAFTSQSTNIEEWIRHSLQNTSLTYQKINALRFVIVQRADQRQLFGYLAGKITDKYGVPLAGATIWLSNIEKGTTTGMNGDYSLPIVQGGYRIQIRFLGYEPVEIENVEIQKNRTTHLHVALKENKVRLSEIIVSRKPITSTITEALCAQRNTPYVSSVLSSQEINRSACSTAKDALKLLSGVTTSENYGITIRGVGGRWNEVLLDGIALPNYDHSYKIFSFDLTPISLVSNISLLKSSTPDIAVGFGNGAAEIITKDIPEQNYAHVSAAAEFNTLSTFRTQNRRQKGKFDFVGFDDGSREMPKNEIPFLPEHFRISERKTLPTQHYNVTVGRTRILKTSGNRFGIILSFSYRNSQQQSAIDHTQRGQWAHISQYTGQETNARNTGHTYQYNTVAGGILNAGWQFGKNRISIRNIFTRSFENNLTTISQYLKDTLQNKNNRTHQFFNYPTFSNLLQNKLEGQHSFARTLLRWNVSHTLVGRQVKDAAFSEMYKPLKNDSLLYFLHRQPEIKRKYPASSGWYGNSEQSFGIGISAAFPIPLKGAKTTATVGYNGVYKQIKYRAEELLIRYKDGSDIDNPSSLVHQTVERRYFDRSMTQHCPFAMVEHRWSNKIRLVWGFRSNYTKSNVADNIGEWHFLPSLNLTYSPMVDWRLQMSYQSSVILPQLADYIPFPAYNAYLLGTSVNRPIEPSSVRAVEFHVEKQIGESDFVSGGLFFRYINRPIERTTQQFRYDEQVYILQNSDKALSYGLEINMRKHLNFIADSDILQNIQLSGGLTLVRSMVMGKRLQIVLQENGENKFVETKSRQKRPLSGQMPYSFNLGIHYKHKNLNANVLFNHSGRQLFVLGENAWQHEYRAPFNSLEVSIGYRFAKSGILLKLSGRNLLNSTQIFYTNTPNDYFRDKYNLPTDNLLPGKTENYNKGHDPIVHKVRNGQTFSLSISKIF